MRNEKTKTSRTLRLMVFPAILMAAGIWSFEGQVNAASLQLARDETSRAASRYADGVYTATGQYGGRPSFITVTLTLTDGVISAVKVIPHARVPRSQELQQSFAAAVPQVVVGRRIDEVKVGKLAGSSGTPVGFNAALEQIKQQASVQ